MQWLVGFQVVVNFSLFLISPEFSNSTWHGEKWSAIKKNYQDRHRVFHQLKAFNMKQ